MADQARIVVIGGGITGVSVAYHLALAGERDVLLLEKAQLTAGSTCQAMGLVTMFNPSSTMLAFRRYSIELYRSLGAFDAVGSVRIASSEDQLRELQRTLSRTTAMGLEAELLSPAETRQRLPAAAPDELYGSVWLPGDGHLDPHTATHAVAAAARGSGARIRTAVRVTGIELTTRGAVHRVHTTDGPIDAEIVVNAAGMWAPQVCAMVGTWIPSTPVDHQHAALRVVAGSELPRDMPCFRDPDRLVYGRSEAGGMLVGGYEAEPPARWIDGVPWDHAATGMPPDYERFAPLLAGAARRFPFLGEAEIGRLVCHPDAMTPDANPLLGPLPGVRGFWVAAGLSLNGFGGAGGIGRAMAGWIATGDPGIDVVAYRAWRFSETYHDPTYAAALAREAYSYYYRLRYPGDADSAGRPRRTSALHARLQDSGAVFTAKAGVERADHHAPGRAWRRAGPDQRAWGWGRPPYMERLAVECRAVRERVGLIDLSSFGKIDLAGPGALPLLRRVAANDVDRPIGSVVYSPFLDERAGMLADVTITRLDIDRFRVVTGAGAVAGDVGWLRLNLAVDDAPVSIRDVSDEIACLGLWGPRARDVLEAAGAKGADDAELPLRRAHDVTIGPAPVLAARLSYVGELGWELYTDRGWATQVWDRLVAAGEPWGMQQFGYRALESLRLEKGYRYYGTDLTAAETPDEAGLRVTIGPERGPFLGRAALEASRRRGLRQRLRTIVIGDDDAFLPLYGGEAVRIEGAVAGRLRSVAPGFTVGRTVGTVYLGPEVVEGTDLTVDVFDARAPGVVAADALVDPAGSRMRG